MNLQTTPYLGQRLTYTDTGKLLDEYGNSVMMEWETEWMKESAKVICQNGGDILNIGFGMGIIDTFIQSYNPTSHWIIEAHNDVYDKMKKDGWLTKKGVKVVHNRWQEVIDNLPKFDGIYFDTWADKGFFNTLLPHLKDILKPNGIFSYWEGASDKFINPKTINALYKDFEIDKIILELNNIPESKEQFEKSHKYYYNPDWKQCVIPIIKHRNTPIKKELI